MDLIKCSLTFTNEHELRDTQQPHVELTEFVSLNNEWDTMWYQNTERDMVS